MKRRSTGVKRGRGPAVLGAHEPDKSAEAGAGSRPERGIIAVLGLFLTIVVVILAGLANHVVGGKPLRAAGAEIADALSFEMPGREISRQLAPREAGGTQAPLSVPVLSVVLLDAGIDVPELDEIAQRDIPLTVAFGTGFDPMRRVRLARMRAAEAEIIVQVPFGFADDLGVHANVLHRDLTAEEQNRRLLWHLARVRGAVGIIDLDGGALLSDVSALGSLMQTLSAQDLLFLDARSALESVALTVARAQGVAAGRRTVRIETGGEAVRKALARAETHARQWETAIVLIEAKPEPLAALSGWLDTRDTRVRLVGLTEAIGRLRAGS